MIFTKRLREGVRNGEITCSVRIWTRPHVIVGNRYRMEEGEIEVDSINPIGFPDITPQLARASGFLGVLDLLKTAQHGPGQNIYLIRFHYIPPARSRPAVKRQPKDRGLVVVPKGEKPAGMPKPDVSKMGYNPANFAWWIGDEPWVPGYSVSYAISFYDARSGTESARSNWWGPRSDPKKLYGGFGLIRIPTDPTGQATARRIWRKFSGKPEKMVHELPDNVTTKYQDDVR